MTQNHTPSERPPRKPSSQVQQMNGDTQHRAQRESERERMPVDPSMPPRKIPPGPR